MQPSTTPAAAALPGLSQPVMPTVQPAQQPEQGPEPVPASLADTPPIGSSVPERYHPAPAHEPHEAHQAVSPAENGGMKDTQVQSPQSTSPIAPDSPQVKIDSLHTATAIPEAGPQTPNSDLVSPRQLTRVGSLVDRLQRELTEEKQRTGSAEKELQQLQAQVGLHATFPSHIVPNFSC